MKASKIKCVKAVVVYGKTYYKANYAAKYWVKTTMWHVFNRRWESFFTKHTRAGVRESDPEYQRYKAAYNRVWDRDRTARFERLVRPVFERLLR